MAIIENNRDNVKLKMKKNDKENKIEKTKEDFEQIFYNKNKSINKKKLRENQKNQKKIRIFFRIKQNVKAIIEFARKD